MKNVVVVSFSRAAAHYVASLLALVMKADVKAMKLKSGRVPEQKLLPAEVPDVAGNSVVYYTDSITPAGLSPLLEDDGFKVLTVEVDFVQWLGSEIIYGRKNAASQFFAFLKSFDGLPDFVAGSLFAEARIRTIRKLIKRFIKFENKLWSEASLHFELKQLVISTDRMLTKIFDFLQIPATESLIEEFETKIKGGVGVERCLRADSFVFDQSALQTIFLLMDTMKKKPDYDPVAFD